jgi:D-amino-acid dehydrogenase
MIETERGYHLFLENPSFQPAFPFMVAEASFVVTPMAKGLRCAGIVEFGGLKAAKSAAPITLLHKRIRQVFPDLEWSGETTWMGHRPSTPDSLPHIGALAENPNIIFAFGAQHIGLTLGPRMGRMAADIAMGRTPNIDMTPFRPERFR